MFAVTSWTWIVAAALGLVSIGLLVRVVIGLILRLKDLNRTLSGASGELRDALDTVRGDLDEVNEGLAEMRRRREEGAR